MKLYRVPMLNDYPEFRGNFLKSTTTRDLAYLSGKGKLHLINQEVQDAIVCLFDRVADKPAISRPTVPIEAYVTSIERLAKAIRG